MGDVAAIFIAVASVITAVTSIIIILNVFKTLAVSRVSTLVKIEIDMRGARRNHRAALKNYLKLLETDKDNVDKELEKRNINTEYEIYMNCLDRLCFFILKSGKGFIKEMKREYEQWLVDEIKEDTKGKYTKKCYSIMELNKIWGAMK